MPRVLVLVQAQRKAVKLRQAAAIWSEPRWRFPRSHQHTHTLMLCLSASVSLPLFVQAAACHQIACACTFCPFCAVFSGFSAWGTADEIFSTRTKSTLLVSASIAPLLLLLRHFPRASSTHINEPRQGTEFSREAEMSFPVYL